MLRFWRASAVPTQEDYLFPGVTGIAVILLALCWSPVPTIARRYRRDTDRAARQDSRARLLRPRSNCDVGVCVRSGRGRRHHGLVASLSLADAAARIRRAASAGALRHAGDVLPLRCRRPVDRAAPSTRRPCLPCDTPGGARRTYSRRRDGSDAADCAAAADPAAAWRRRRPRAAGRRCARERGGDVPGDRTRPADRQRLFGLLAAALHDPVAGAAPRRCVAARSRSLPDTPSRSSSTISTMPVATSRGSSRACPAIERFSVTSAGTVFRLPRAATGAARRRAGRRSRFSRTTPAGQRLVVDLIDNADRPRRHVQPALALPGARRTAPHRTIGRRAVVGTGVAGLDRRTGRHRRDRRPAGGADPHPAPDVRARYLRIYPAPSWLGREVRVSGP